MEELKRLRERDDDRGGTWPPTTAIEGKASQSVGNALSSPWSPSAVHALCSLFTNVIRFSIYPEAWFRSASRLGGCRMVSELTLDAIQEEREREVEGRMSVAKQRKRGWRMNREMRMGRWVILEFRNVYILTSKK